MFNSGVRGRRAPDNFGTVSSQTQFVQQKSPQPSITGYTISGTDDTALNPAGGQTVLVNGTGFASGAAVTVNGQTISPVTVVSPTQLSFTSIALAGGSYSLIVYNSTGGAAILVPGLIYSAVPTWTTSAGSIGTTYETTPISTSVVATSDSAITYSLSSGSLPSGATLYANGVITGTSPIESGSTTYTFAIKAEDAELQDTTRTFTLTINTDVVTWNSPANNTTYTANINEVASNVVLSATSAAGYGITYTANTLPTGLSLAGNTISGTPTVVANSSTLLTATASTTNRSATRTINWVVQLGSDPYFYLTTLLLNGETSSNYWIQDASTNKFSLTINGDTRPVAFSPYETSWSNLFDGTNDYISTPANTAFAFGTGDFTIECWVRTTDFSLAGGGYSRSIMRVGDLDFYLRINQYHGGTNGALRVTGLLDGSTVALTDDKWHHIAVVRESNIVRYWIDGVYQTECSGSSVTTNFSNADLNVVGGRSNPIDGYFNGHISNVRIVKGTAVYTGTSNFTVSTTPLTAVTGTSLLTCQSNRMIDNSSNNFTISNPNGAVVSNFSPLVETDLITGSGYFDGTGDYLTAPSNSALTLTADFTIEFWIYPTASYNSQAIAGTTASSLRFDSGGFFYLINSGAQYINTQTGSFLTLNVWTHVAIVRNSSTLYIFRSGVSIGIDSAGSPGSATFDFSGLSIGYSPHSFGGIFTGYISNFRIVKGTAVYTSAFIPPTSPLTAVANTSLLTLQNRFGENNNRFVDTSGFNNIVTKFANATQGTFSPFSQTGWSSSFNGSNDPVSLASTTSLNIESVDFTIEAWIYMNVMPTGTSTTSWSGDWSQWFIIYERSAGGTSGWQFRVGATLLTLGGDGDSSIAWGTHGMVANTWYHVAASRASSTYRLFVNGTSLTLTTQGTSMGTSGTYYIGSEDTSGANFNGYISNLRVIKSQAIYTAGFTPSTTPLSNYSVGSTGAGAAVSITGSVSLLTCNSNVWIDNSPNRNAISRSGVNTTVQAFSPFAPTIITPTSYSGYFDGSGDYLTVPASTAFQFDTGDYTIEAWLYSSTTSWSVYATGGSGAIDQFVCDAGTLYWFYTIFGGGVANYYTSADLNVWTHVAVCRNSGTNRIFKNGVVIATASSSTAIGSNNILQIGRRSDGIYHLTGYLSNLRVLKGTGLYTGAFTPSTSPLTVIANTSLLTCQSNRFIDNSANNFTITVNGNVTPSQFNPFGNTSLTGDNAVYSITNVGGSMYFDGTGDYLTAVASFNTSRNWTIEGWCYFTNSANNDVFICASSDRLYIQWLGTTFYLGDASINNISFVSKPINVWFHIAVVKNSTNYTVYFNGVVMGTSTSALFTDTVTTWQIGARTSQSIVARGYISNLRIISGVALYTSVFVPPATPLAPIPGSTLLLNGTNSGLIDYTGKNALESVGNMQLRTVVTKFGNASMYFDGTDDVLRSIASPNLDFRTGSFTVEFWMYAITTANNPAVMTVGSDAEGLVVRFVGGNWYNYWVGAGDIFGTSGIAVTTGQWVHVAWIRNGTSMRFFVNGTQIGNTVTSGANHVSTGGASVGGPSTSGTAFAVFNGYIDDVRITKGYARYTTNFTAPTSAFITY